MAARSERHHDVRHSRLDCDEQHGGGATLRRPGRGIGTPRLRFCTAAAPARGYRFSATANGLLPGTAYNYRIWVGGQDVTPWPSTGFRTASAGQTLSFAVLGDSRGDAQGGSPDAARVAAQMARFSFDFALHVGDIVYTGSGSEYDPHYFIPFRDLIGHIPFYPVPGNHEYVTGDIGPFLERFYLPTNGPAELAERVYSFDRGSAHFTALDSNMDYRPGSAQYRWLESDLSSTQQTWKFVMLHHPMYSSGYHGWTPDAHSYLIPLFERYGVDVVFAGHDHHYERTVPVVGGAPAPAGEHGVIYMITGGGGSVLYPAGTGPLTAVSKSVFHFVRADAGACRARFVAIDVDGTPIDSFELSKCPAGAPETRLYLPVIVAWIR